MKLVEKSNFFGSAGSANVMQYPLNGPSDYENGIDREEQYIPDKDYMKTCLYHQIEHRLPKVNPLTYYQPCERVIARLVVPEVMSSITGYGGYGIGTDGNFYGDYYDGSATDFNTQADAGKTNFDDNRHFIIKIDNKTGKLSVNCIDETGGQSEFSLKTSPKVKIAKSTSGHSSCGIVFAIVANAICQFEKGLIDIANPVFPVYKTLYTHFTDYVNEKNSAGSIDDQTKALRCLDGDIYTLLKFNNEIVSEFGGNIFNSMLYEMDDFPMLEDASHFPEMDIFHGDSAILGGRKVLSNFGSFVREEDVPNMKTVKELLKDAAHYVLNPSRVLTEEEEAMVPDKSDMIPNKEILTKIKLIRESRALPQPYRNLMWLGETGSGKTTAVQIMAQLFHLPYKFMTINPETQQSDLYVNVLPNNSKASKDQMFAFTESLPTASDIALDPVSAYKEITGEDKADATEGDCFKAITQKSYELFNQSSDFMYVYSPFVEAFKNGYVFEFQEANVASKPGVLSGINAALDDLQTIELPTGEIIKRHPDCIIVMTANVDYEGTRRLNQAVKSRCALKGIFKLPEEDALVNTIKLDSGYSDEANIKKMIKVMNSIRKVLEETGTTDGSCGQREIIAWASATKILGDPYTAALNTIVPSATDDQEVIPDVIGALRTQFLN